MSTTTNFSALSQPLVSLILCVKNGLPYLPEALASVERQSYRHFELVVQDCLSTDGTLELIRNFRGAPHIALESANDGGIGPAYNRAVTRCRGEIIGTIDADNLLADNALELAVDYLTHHVDSAAVYGSAYMIRPDGSILYPWSPTNFQLRAVLSCKLVPPFGNSFFARERCGAELRFDSSLLTCADFDLWLRLAGRPIHRLDAILGSTRLSDASMTCRPQTYDQMCRDKVFALQQYFSRPSGCPFPKSVLRWAEAGVYAWAAESILGMTGPTQQFDHYFAQSRRLYPHSPRLQKLRKRAQEMQAQHTRSAA
jgi:hypothetical protein